MGTSADPRVERSRAVILAAASRHFVTHGYLGANVDLIAADARVSKRTIYNLYEGKEALFREVVEEAVATAELYARETAAHLGEVSSADEGLREAGRRLARTVVTSQVVRLRRLLIAETERFPDFATEYYDRAPGLVLRTLAAAIGRLAERGLLQVPDADLAAEHFAFLVMGASLDRALFDDAVILDLDEVTARADAGVDLFLTAYAIDVSRAADAGRRKADRPLGAEAD